jgi:signal peptidase II
MATALHMSRQAKLLLLITLLLAADQLTKSIARATLATEMPRQYGFVTLMYTTNPGAFLSIGASLPPNIRAALFSGIVTIALGIAAIALVRGNVESRADELALAAIIAGGFGNLVDRLRFGGRVTDFLYLSAGPLHTGVFNVADVAITCGILWLALSWAPASWRATKRRRASKSVAAASSKENDSRSL